MWKKCLLLLMLTFLLTAFWGSERQPAAAAVTVALTEPRQSSRLVKEFRDEETVVRPWIERYGTAVVFAAIFMEGVGIPAPGLTFLIVATLESIAGKGPHFSVLLFGAFLSATLGNTVGYAAGRLGGRRLLSRLRVDDRRLGPLEQGFRRYGGWLIVMARFLDGLKQLNGIAAGILAMPLRTFAVFNALGAALWVGFFGLGTCYVDEHISTALGIMRRLNPWFAVGAGLAALVVLWWFLGPGHRRKHPPNDRTGP